MRIVSKDTQNLNEIAGVKCFIVNVKMKVFYAESVLKCILNRGFWVIIRISMQCYMQKCFMDMTF